MRTRLIHVLVTCACLALIACERRTPPAPTPGGNQGETITGRERIGWDQQAGGAAELATFRYAIYVDGMRSEVADVTCATTAGAAGFACSGRLPSIAAGSHTLELATFVFEGTTILESARSTALRVTVTGATAGNGVVAWTSGDAGVTSDGVPLFVERLADGLVEPVDAVAAPDGRVFVVERGGRILQLTAGSEGAARELEPLSVHMDDELDGGGVMLSLALDADFARTRLVYVLYATTSRDGGVYRLARFREMAGRLGERAILLNRIAPASEPPSGAVRIGPAGRILIAVAGSRGGTLASSFVFGGLDSPGGLAWDAARTLSWIVDRRADGGVLTAVDLQPNSAQQVRLAQRFKDRDASSLVVYDGTAIPEFAGDILIASEAGRHILRVKVDVESGRTTGEPLLQDQVGGIRVVTVAPDGAVYFLTGDAAGRLHVAR